MDRGVNILRGRRHPWWLPHLEALGGFLVLTWFFLYFYGKSSLLYPRFHPFLVIVLLLAGRYGFVAGLTSALMGTFDYYLILLWQNHWDTLMPEEFSFLWPSAFLFSGMVVGELRDGEARRSRDIEEKYHKERDVAQTATLQLEILLKAKKELEKRIFLEPNVVSDLFDVFRTLEKDQIDSIPSTLLSLCTSFAGADSVALYRRERKGFVVEASSGNLDVPGEVPLNYLPFARSYELGEAITLRSHGILQEFLLDGRKRLAPVGVYPIHAREDRVRFLLVIWHVPFEKLAPDFFHMLRMIADRASSRLQFLETHNRIRESVSIEESTGFLRPVFFARRSAEELNKAFRYKSPVSLLEITFRSGGGMVIDSRPMLSGAREILKPLLRSEDLVGLLGDHSGACVCLPYTSEEGAGIVEKKFKQFWDQTGPSIPMLSGIHPDIRHFFFTPIEGVVERNIGLYRSMIKKLDSIFRQDPVTGVFSGKGFYEEFLKECALDGGREKQITLVRLHVTEPDWEELLTLGNFLRQKKNIRGKFLLQETAIVGVPLEGTTLWILVADNVTEDLDSISTAIADAWNELDIPRLKKGDFSIMSRVVHPETAWLDSGDPLATALGDLSSAESVQSS